VGTTGRLRGRADFDRVFRQGRAVAGRLLVIRYARQAEAQTRVAFAVGRQLGGAVLRNRVRRRWREVVRGGPPLRAGWDVVLIARAPCVGASWEALVDAWAEAVRRAGLRGTEG
jgi:ribonuclease P protein component